MQNPLLTVAGPMEEEMTVLSLGRSSKCFCMICLSVLGCNCGKSCRTLSATDVLSRKRQPKQQSVQLNVVCMTKQVSPNRCIFHYTPAMRYDLCGSLSILCAADLL